MRVMSVTVSNIHWKTSDSHNIYTFRDNETKQNFVCFRRNIQHKDLIRIK